MDRSSTRAAAMQRMLDEALTEPASLPLRVTARRFRAVECTSTSAAAVGPVPEVPCEVSSWSSLGKMRVFELERRAVAALGVPTSGDPAVRCGLVGAFVSPYEALAEYVASLPSHASDYLLILEDDTFVKRAFFERLPSLLAHVPAGWHAIRFSTWGLFQQAAVDEKDRISQDAPVYRVAHTPGTFANYMGAHATLYQATTARDALKVLAAHGAFSPDVALKSWPADGTGEQLGANGAPEFFSYAYQLPELVGLSGLAHQHERAVPDRWGGATSSHKRGGWGGAKPTQQLQRGGQLVEGSI